MMLTFSKYNATGKVLWHGAVPDTMLNMQDDTIVFGAVDPATEYVLDRTIVPRRACPAALNGATLTGLPVPCTLTVNGQDYAVAETAVTLSFPHPGDYEMKVVYWPYMDATFSVRT